MEGGGRMRVNSPRCCAPGEKQCWGWLTHSQLEFGLAGPVELNVNHTLHLRMCSERHSSSVGCCPASKVPLHKQEPNLGNDLGAGCPVESAVFAALSLNCCR